MFTYSVPVIGSNLRPTSILSFYAKTTKAKSWSKPVLLSIHFYTYTLVADEMLITEKGIHSASDD